MSDNGDLLKKLNALRDQAETAEFVETLRIASHIADEKTTLFQVTNSKLNTYFVLATTKVDALAILEREGGRSRCDQEGSGNCG
jgi:hypothetical protein